MLRLSKIAKNEIVALGDKLRLASYYASLSTEPITHSKFMLAEARIYMKADDFLLDKVQDLIQRGCHKLRSRLPRLRLTQPDYFRCYRERLFFAHVAGKKPGNAECSALCHVAGIIREGNWPSWDPDVRDIIRINSSLRVREAAEWCTSCTTKVLRHEGN